MGKDWTVKDYAFSRLQNESSTNPAQHEKYHVRVGSAHGMVPGVEATTGPKKLDSPSSTHWFFWSQ